MIVSMIKGEIFRVSWSLLTRDQHHSSSFFMHIMKFEIENISC
jgi:hypothetical protein